MLGEPWSLGQAGGWKDHRGPVLHQRCVEPDHSWLAVMTEMPDPLEERRRLSRKTPPELAKMTAKDEDQGEKGRDPEPKSRPRILQLIMEEMTALMEDPSEQP
eukprot:s194_g49.t1